jgi:hypothetical protein
MIDGDIVHPSGGCCHQREWQNRITVSFLATTVAMSKNESRAPNTSMVPLQMAG